MSTVSRFVLAGVCASFALTAGAADEKPAPAPAETPVVAQPAGKDKAAPPAELPKVDLTTAAPRHFKELDVEKGGQTRNESELEIHIRSNIRRLSTSGWREAEVELLEAGKDAVPFLIEALAPLADSQAYPAIAFNLGGHTKADAPRGTRERTLAEACTEVLTDMVVNHSDYKGDVPTVDQKAWQEWWKANEATVKFGN